jgi:hypothetical protein
MLRPALHLHYNRLQYITIHYNYITILYNYLLYYMLRPALQIHYNTLQLHYNTLQYITITCCIVCYSQHYKYITIHYITLHYNALQLPAILYVTPSITITLQYITITCCIVCYSQHYNYITIHYNTLQLHYNYLLYCMLRLASQLPVQLSMSFFMLMNHSRFYPSSTLCHRSVRNVRLHSVCNVHSLPVHKRQCL